MVNEIVCDADVVWTRAVPNRACDGLIVFSDEDSRCGEVRYVVVIDDCTKLIEVVDADADRTTNVFGSVSAGPMDAQPRDAHVVTVNLEECVPAWTECPQFWTEKCPTPISANRNTFPYVYYRR